MSVYCPALEQALASYRKPARAMQLRERELPDGIGFLLRVVAGEAKARAQACDASGESESVVLEAVVLFIQQVMLFPGSDSYRVLGVGADAEDRLIKEHYRLLVRWLHPDRNDNAWEALYAERVNRAWQDLRTPERRELLAARSPADTTPLHVAPLASPSRLSVVTANEGFVLSANTTRRLPTLILGSLAIGAALVLLMQYHLMQSDGPETTLSSTREPRAKPALVAATPARVVASPILTPSPVQEPLRPTLPAVPELALAYVVAEGTPDPAPSSAVVQPSQVSAPLRRIIVPAQAPAAASAASVIEVVASTAEPVPQPAPVARVQLIDEASAQALMLRFRSAFASGNIAQMRTLLASEPLAVRGEREQILSNYDQLFASSVSRWIRIENASWLTQDDTAILIASYQAWVVPKGASTSRRSTGDIRFDLREQGGELRIVQLRQQPSRAAQ